MIKLNMQQLLFTAFALTLSAFSLSTQAHELRYIGDNYWIQVGAHVEPPYTHIWNGIDVFPFHNDNPLPPPNELDGVVSIDKRTGDRIVLEAEAIIVGYDAFNAPILKKIDLEKKWQIVDYDIFTQYFQDKAFVLNKPTAYGFIVEGYIQRKKSDGTFFKGKHFKEKFVCEGGSQDITYGTAFECMHDDPNAPNTPPVHHDKNIHLQHHDE